MYDRNTKVKLSKEANGGGRRSEAKQGARREQAQLMHLDKDMETHVEKEK